MLKPKTKSVVFAIMVLFSGLLIGSCSEDEVKVVDKTELEASITEAKDLITNSAEGTAAGNFLRGSKAALQNAIDIAQVVYDLPEATEATVIGANGNLKAAINTFKGKVVSPIDAANLVGHWTFDELTSAAAGATVKDYSGNNRNGTTKAGNTYFNGGNAGIQPQLGTDRYGNAGKALVLNKGANVEIPYNSAFSTEERTISVWVKLAEKRNNRFIGLHSWLGYKFEVQDGNRPFLTIHASSNTFNSYTGINSEIYDRDAATEIGLNAWYHLVATYKAGSMKFYINGVMVKSWENTPNPALTQQISSTLFNLVLGCDFPTDKYAANAADHDNLPSKPIPAEWGGYLNGSLDEVRLYKKALTDAQVVSIYDLEKPN